MRQKRVTTGVEIKDEEKGIVRARFASLNVKDKEGDLIERGAFGRQKVRISAYGHTSWGGALPVGVGEIHEEGDEAIADLKFFISTSHGRDHFATVRGLGELGRWSFGYDVIFHRKPSSAQRQAGVNRILERLRVHEVSPVMEAAGIRTQTLAVKRSEACAAGELRRARARLRAAEEALEGRERGPWIRGASSGITSRAEFTGKPSDEARRLARFAAGVGWRLHRKAIAEPPKLLWFRSDSLPWGASSRIGFADPGGSYIALLDSLEGEKLAETALHELRHIGQVGVRFTDHEAELDAEAFTRRWLRPTLRAFSTTGGELSRLAVSDATKPSGWAPHMDVRLTRTNAKIWERDNHTTHEAWKELYA